MHFTKYEQDSNNRIDLRMHSVVDPLNHGRNGGSETSLQSVSQSLISPRRMHASIAVEVDRELEEERFLIAGQSL